MGMFDDLIPGSGAPSAAPQQGMFDDLIPQKNAPPAVGGPRNLEDLIAERKAREPSLLARVKDTFTGESRTEFPNAQEFTPALFKTGNQTLEEAKAGKEPAYTPQGVMRSSITSDPMAALDILQKQIPGLEAAQDKFGNVMLKAPGMKDWTYLNKPGLSGRDIDELGTQTLATLPFMGVAGQGATLPARIASGAGFMGAGEIARQGMEKAAGSEQEPDTGRLGMVTALGGALAPGVPTAVAGQVAQAGRVPLRYVGDLINPGNRADRLVAEAFRNDLPEPVVGRMYRGPRGPESMNPSEMSPEMLQERAGNALQERAAVPGGATYGGDVRVADIGGENTRRLARSAANMSPEAGETLNRVIQPRFESQGPRFIEFLQEMSSGNPTAQMSRDALDELAYSARAPFYEASFREGANGFVTPRLQELMNSPAVQDAMAAAHRELLNKQAAGRLTTAAQGPGGQTLEYWDQVKRILQSDYNTLSGRGRNTEAGNIAGITQRLIAELDRIVPSYETARGVSMGIFRANNALDAGENFVTSRLTNDAAREALHQMSPQEQNLFRQGYVSRLIEHVRELGDRRTLVSMIGQSPAARERLEIALGEDGARQLEAFLQNERMMDFVRTAVSGNSTTARQLRDMVLASAVGGTITSFDPHDPKQWVVGALTGAFTKYSKGRINAFLDTRLANEIADRLVSRDPTVMRRGLEQLSQPRALQALRAFDDERMSLSGAAQAAPENGSNTSKLPRNAMKASEADSNSMVADVSPGATATNPETGERLRFDGRGWQTIRTQ